MITLTLAKLSKRIYFVVIVVITYAFSPVVYAQQTRTLFKRIQSDKKSFKHDIRLEVKRKEAVRIYAVGLKHITKKEGREKRERLYIKGMVEKRVSRRISDVTVSAKLFDKNGTLIADEKGKVIPRILGVGRLEKGVFKIVTNYNPRIALCKLEVDWAGKHE